MIDRSRWSRREMGYRATTSTKIKLCENVLLNCTVRSNGEMLPEVMRIKELEYSIHIKEDSALLQATETKSPKLGLVVYMRRFFLTIEIGRICLVQLQERSS